MSADCWNCGRAGEQGKYCLECGQLLHPEENQRDRIQDRIEYLIGEVRSWNSVPPWWKEEAEANYRKRLQRLAALFDPPPEAPRASLAEPGEQAVEEEQVASEALGSGPDSAELATPAWRTQARRSQSQALDPTPFAQLLSEEGAQPPPLPAQAPHPGEPSEADLAMRMLVEAFSEKKIRALYALGGVLLVSAGVGTLRSSWDGWGRQVMALLLTALPWLFFWISEKLREKLPVSSRMCTVLGGGMFPVGILFLNTFGVAGLQAPQAIWNPLAFFLGWFVNLRLSRKGEVICTYLAGLCWGLAAWLSGSGLWLGLLSFAGALSLFRWSSQDIHLQRVGHGLSWLGLLAAFTRGPLEAGSAATLFLLAIVYFCLSASVSRTPVMFLVSSLVVILSSWWMSSLFHWPYSSVGLASLIHGSLLLYQSRGLDQEGEWARSLAIGLSASVLLVFLGMPLALQILTHFAGVSAQQLLTCALTGALAALYYAVAGVRFQRPNWLYASSLAALYAYFCLLALAFHSQPSLYRPWLLAMALLWQLAIMVLRNRVPAEYLRPWVWTAAGLSFLMVPLNMVLQMVSADVYTPWIYLGVAAVTALSAVFERDPRGLYGSMITAALAYATWLPIWFGSSQESNLGLAFAPFVSAIALLGLGLQRSRASSDSADYARPLLLTAALAGWCFSLLQIFYGLLGYWKTLPPALLFYGGVAAFLAWRLPSGQVRRYLEFHASLCLLSALAALDRFSPLGVGIVYGLSLGLFLGLTPRGIVEGCSLWLAVAAWIGPEELRPLPGLIWLVGPLFNRRWLAQERERFAMFSFLVLLPAWSNFYQSPLAWLLFGASLAQIHLALRLNSSNLLTLGWLQLKVTYLCAFTQTGFELWTLALWLEWGSFHWLESRMSEKSRTLTHLTALFLLLSSSALGSGLDAVSCGAMAAVFFWRSLKLRDKTRFFVSHAVAAWACLLLAQSLQASSFFPALLFVLTLVDLWLLRGDEELRQWALQAMNGLTALAWSLLLIKGFHWDGVPAHCLGAGAWLWRAYQTEKSALWVSFGLLYHLYVLMAIELGIDQLEAYSIPLAAWFLLWGSRFSDSPGFRQLGLLGMLLPSLFLSLYSAEHALWAGSAGLLVLLWGLASSRSNLLAWGGLAILLEVGIQALLFAANLPWHLWAVAGGLLLVTLAALVERRRQEVLQASRSFLEKLNHW